MGLLNQFRKWLRKRRRTGRGLCRCRRTGIVMLNDHMPRFANGKRLKTHR